MKKPSGSDGNGSQNDGDEQGKSKSGKLRKARKERAGEPITKADFAGYLRLRDARCEMLLANQLAMTAGQAAAMLRCLKDELFHLYQTLPRFHAESERMVELDTTVDKLAEELETRAGNKVADATSSLIDADCWAAYPEPPGGMTPEEALIIEAVDAGEPNGREEEDILDYVWRHTNWRLSIEALRQVVHGLEERGLIARVNREKDGEEVWVFAGALKGGLR